MALALALAGCGGGDDDGDSKDDAASPAASQAPASPSASTDPDAAVKAAVLAAYSRMWDEQMKAYRKADVKDTDLEKYATLDALGQFRNDLARMKDAGTVVRGELAHHDTKVTGLDLDAQTPKALLSDCMDISKWQTYSTKKGKVLPMPTNQPLRYIATAKAERWKGQWLITTFTTHGDRTC
ncbi:hypothetical protein [Streptomyces sp. NPDC049744]|uniref:hypothetical protein n=1 Tax=Streptomyces sp. NPDC049744 TaxID=3154359 RepID=UPI0034330882